MATIIPRTAGPQVAVQATPGVRNTTQVDLSPMVQGIRQVQGVAMDIAQKAKDEADLTALMKAQSDLDGFEASAFDPANNEGMAKHQGINALGAQDALIPKYDQRVDEIRRGLTRDQRAKFQQISAQNRARFTQRVQGESYRRYELAARQQREASMQGGQESAAAAGIAGDFQRQEELIGTVLGMYDASGATAGDSPEVTAAAQRDAVSNIRYATVRGMLNRPGGIGQARAYLDQYGESLTVEHRLQIESALEPAESDARQETRGLVYIDGGELPGADDQASDEAAPSTPEAVQARYEALGTQFGFVSTSTTRTVEENTRVGGVANSQHLTTRGTARDWSVKGKTPQQIAAFKAALEADGFEVITKTHGTGPHVHAELPPGRRAQSGRRIPAATTLEEALAAMRANESDPAERKGIEQHIRRTFADRRAARIDAESSALETMRTAIEERALNSKSWREAVGPEYAAMAIRQGWSGILESQWKERRGETLTETDPLVYDRYARLLLDNPTAFASKETRLALQMDAGSLSTADRGRLMGEWSELNDPKKREATIRRRRVEASLVAEGVQALKWTDSKHKDRAAAFGLAISQARTSFRDKNGGNDPTPEQDRALVRDLVRSFARNPDALVRGAKEFSNIDLTLSPRDIERARQTLAAAGNANPTQDEITREAIETTRSTP